MVRTAPNWSICVQAPRCGCPECCRRYFGGASQIRSDWIGARNLRFGGLGVLGSGDLRRIAGRAGGPSADGDLQPCVVWRAQGQSAVCGAVGEAARRNLVEEVGEIEPGQLVLDLVG